MPYKNAISGIYKITNTVSGKFYVGSSYNILKRFTQHKGDLRKGTHGNSKLQNAWNKYGEDAFKLEVLCKCPSEYVIKLEQWFVDNINPYYNIRKKVVESNLGITIDASVYSKILKTKEARGIINRKVYEYNLKGEYVREWNNAKEVIQTKGYTASVLRYCLQGKLNKCKDGIFKYEKHDSVQPYSFKRPNQVKRQLVYKKDKQGNILKTYHGLKECSSDLGIPRGTITAAVFYGSFGNKYYIIEYGEKY